MTANNIIDTIINNINNINFNNNLIKDFIHCTITKMTENKTTSYFYWKEKFQTEYMKN